MKSTLLTALSFLCLCATAQLRPGFDKQEALDMIQLCNSYPYIEIYNSDEDILPEGYKKTYTTGVFGMDNMFQVYTCDRGYAVINVRGSTDKKISWMENFYSSMIPSSGTIQIKDRTIDYQFAADSAATVHAGYALGIAYMADDLHFHINYLNALGIHDIMLTGHSQGGAICQLLMSYLHYLPEGILSDKNTFKTYSFAAPRVGNAAFVADYDTHHTASDMSHLIIIEEDVVPSLPLAYRDGPLISEEEITALFNKEQDFDFQEVVRNGFYNLFEKPIAGMTGWLSTKVSKQIHDDLGSYTIPEYTKDINYGQIGNLRTLPPAEYPDKIDETQSHTEAQLAELKESADHEKKGSKFYQHKPHNYYISLLKAYFPERYEVTEPKYLAENL